MGSKLAPLLSAYCLIALFELEENIFFAPSIKLLENAVCQKHYAVLDPNQVPVNETFCKTGQIKSQPFLPLKDSFMHLLVLLMGMSFGNLADE